MSFRQLYYVNIYWMNIFSNCFEWMSFAWQFAPLSMAIFEDKHFRR